MAKVIWCVRHAPVDASGVCYGQHDVPTRIGAAEAAAIVVRALRGPFASVHVSRWARARLVGEIVAKTLGVPLVIDDRIAELSMGEWEGRRFVDIEREDAARYARWMDAWRTEAPPGGETIAELEARVGAWMEDARGDEPRVAITHAGVIRAMRARIARTSYEEAMKAAVDHLVPERLELG